MASPSIDSQTRVIRNIQIIRQDLEPLLPTRNQEIPGTPINAYGTVVQDVQRRESGLCFFSSRIPILLDHENTPGSAGHKELNEHIHVAGGPELIQHRSRWAIPLCGGPPQARHWVLGWVDFDMCRYGLYDSLPRLNARAWAEPLLLNSLNAIHRSFSAPAPGWHSEHWAFVLITPPQATQQDDNWSCGVFTLLAMSQFASADPLGMYHEGKNNIKIMKQGVLRLLLELPIYEYKKRQRDSQCASTIPDARAIAQPTKRIRHDNPISPLGAAAMRTLTVPSSPQLDDTTAETVQDELTTKAREPGPSSKRSAAASGPRAAKQTLAQRRDSLEADKWTLAVEPHRVKCAGCFKWLKLHPKTTYAAANWNRHRTECAQITGSTVVRLGHPKQKANTIPTGVPPITAFLGRNKAGPQLETLDVNAKVSAATQEAVMSGTSAKAPLTLRRMTSTTPSIATHFALSTTSPALNKLPAEPQLSFLSPSKGFRPHSISDIGSDRLPGDVPCRHLHGEGYHYYLATTHTRSLGGVSIQKRAHVKRELFPYKCFPALKSGTPQSLSNATPDIPLDGNAKQQECEWTLSEQRKLDNALRSYARWIVDPSSQSIRSPGCQLRTTNASGICDACQAITKDEAFQHAIQRKHVEEELPDDERREKIAAREKHAPRTLYSADIRELRKHLDDPLLFDLWTAASKDDCFSCYLQLYRHAKQGKLIKHQMFTEISSVLADRVCRDTSDNVKLKYGIRYTKSFLNFSLFMRGRGQFAAQTYEVLGESIALPTARQLRSLVANSEDCLQNPDLHYLNLARVKRFVTARRFNGGLAVSSDCTKVRQRVSYSTDFGGHILGSTLPLNECAVCTPQDIDHVITRIQNEGAFAKQSRAILVKVPEPDGPLFIVALLPTDGSDNAELIHSHHCRLLEMASQLQLRILTFAADGASTELNAQMMMDQRASDLPPVTYEYPAYGIALRAPVFTTTGPLVSLTDPEHARKTARNQPQHGTHTASMGQGCLVYHSLVDLNNVKDSGLVLSDVQNVDKQDDGAARRLFHSNALKATTYELDGQAYIKSEFLGLHVFLSVLGLLFDAWLNRRMPIKDRLLAALRARFFLHIWWCHVRSMASGYPDLLSTQRSFISPASFKILNRLCDTMVLLGLIYAEHYPDQPFCPWLLGTNLLEHFFGTARSLVPNFTYPELLKLVKHIMLRQQYLLARKNTMAAKERTARAGYILDYDNTPLSPDELQQACVRLPRSDLNKLVELAATEAKAICVDILKMRSPRAPWSLASISTPLPHRSRQAVPTPEADSDNSDVEDEAAGIADESNEGSDTGDPDSLDSEVLADGSLSQQVKLAAYETGRLLALSEDYETTASAVEKLKEESKSSELLPLLVTTPTQSATTKAETSPLDSEGPVIHSTFVSPSGKVSVASLLSLRAKHQEGARVRSQRIFQVDAKFADFDAGSPEKSPPACELDRAWALQQWHEVDSAQDKSGSSNLNEHATETSSAATKTLTSRTMTAKEASHRVRVVQQLNGKLPRETNARLARWTTVASGIQQRVPMLDVPNVPAKNITQFNALRRGSAVLVKNAAGRLYVGEVLDILKKVDKRYASIDESVDGKGVVYLSLQVYLPLCHNDSSDEDEEDEFYEDDPNKLSAVPIFSCEDQRRGHEGYLYTHARMQDVIYHFGFNTLTGIPTNKSLTKSAAKQWQYLNTTAVKSLLRAEQHAEPRTVDT